MMGVEDYVNEADSNSLSGLSRVARRVSFTLSAMWRIQDWPQTLRGISVGRYHSLASHGLRNAVGSQVQLLQPIRRYDNDNDIHCDEHERRINSRLLL